MASNIIVKSFKVFSLLFGIVLISVTSDDRIPLEFNEICKIQPPVLNNYPVQITCDISENDKQTWRLSSLRNWAKTKVDMFPNGYAYQISCGYSPKRISLPWPMSSLGLRFLKVQNCNITNIFDDFLHPEIDEWKDQLVEIDIVDSVMSFKHSKMLYMLTNIQNITSAYECIHESTIEKYIFRNITYEIDEDLSIQDMIESCKADRLSNPDLPESDSNNTLSRSLQNNTQSNDTMPTVNVPALQNTNDPCSIEKIFFKIQNLPKAVKYLEIECNYKKLKYMDDSAGNVMSVYNNRFLTKYNKFPVLEFLNLSNNGMVELGEELYDWTFYFNVLSHMDLSHNKISVINFRTPYVDNHGNNTYINLQYNNITTLKLKDLNMLRRQLKTTIDIKNNPIHCDCSLMDVVNSFSKPETFTGNMKQYKYITDMTCYTPDNLKGKPLRSLNRDILECDLNQAWIFPFTFLAAIVVVFGGLVILGFIYRREIRILFYTRLNILMPGDKLIELGKKKYHAFISYSNQDEEWVEDILCKRLEASQVSSESEHSNERKQEKRDKLRDFKLCLHGRNFIAGLSIIENIVNSIQSSRHTIIILSSNFINSKWSMEEFVQAYNQSILERRRHLVIVILEDVPDKQLDPLLRRCLKTFTYLKASDKLFYDRLAYALSFERKMTKSEIAEEKSLVMVENKNYTSKLNQEDTFYSYPESVTTESSCLSTQCSTYSTDSFENYTHF